MTERELAKIQKVIDKINLMLLKGYSIQDSDGLDMKTIKYVILEGNIFEIAHDGSYSHITNVEKVADFIGYFTDMKFIPIKALIDVQEFIEKG